MLNVKLSTYALLSVLVSTQIIGCGKSKKSTDEAEQTPAVEVTSSQPQDNPPKAETPSTTGPAPETAPAPAPVPAPVPEASPAPQVLPVIGTWLSKKFVEIIEDGEGGKTEHSIQVQVIIAAESFSMKTTCTVGELVIEKEKTTKITVTDTHLEFLEDLPSTGESCEPEFTKEKIAYQVVGDVLTISVEDPTKMEVYQRVR